LEIFIFFDLVFYIVEIIDCGPKPFANKSCIKKVRKQNIKRIILLDEYSRNEFSFQD
jgi:hypothetical protein